MTSNTEAPKAQDVLWNFLATPKTIDQIKDELAYRGVVIADIPRAVRRLRNDNRVTVVNVKLIEGSSPRAFTYEAY